MHNKDEGDTLCLAGMLVMPTAVFIFSLLSRHHFSPLTQEELGVMSHLDLIAHRLQVFNSAELSKPAAANCYRCSI